MDIDRSVVLVCVAYQQSESKSGDVVSSAGASAS